MPGSKLPHNSAFAVPIQSLDIMVIDDSDSMLRLFRTCLTAFGIPSVRVFNSSYEAMVAMRDNPPDMVLIDWRMGPMTGIELLHHMRRVENPETCHIAVIMVTGHGSANYVREAMLAGAQQFLVKPVSPRTLFDRIAWVTEDERIMVQKDRRFVIKGVEERLAWQRSAPPPREVRQEEIVEL